MRTPGGRKPAAPSSSLGAKGSCLSSLPSHRNTKTELSPKKQATSRSVHSVEGKQRGCSLTHAGKGRPGAPRTGVRLPCASPRFWLPAAQSPNWSGHRPKTPPQTCAHGSPRSQHCSPSSSSRTHRDPRNKARLLRDGPDRELSHRPGVGPELDAASELRTVHLSHKRAGAPNSN